MRTLSQIRAANALICVNNDKLRTKEGGDIINKLPAYIQNNGLLATLAFCFDKSKKAKKNKQNDQKQYAEEIESNGYAEVAAIIIKHLGDDNVNIVKAENLEDLINKLSDKQHSDASLLRRATAETLALLNYMKRFAE